MRVIVAGSRVVADKKIVERAVFHPQSFPISELVHGGCRGVDSVSHDLCEGVVPIKVFPANWKKYGRAAGPIRNRQMAEYGDALIAIWDGKSRGTWNMILEMSALKKPIAIHWTDCNAIALGWHKVKALESDAKSLPCTDSCTAQGH